MFNFIKSVLNKRNNTQENFEATMTINDKKEYMKKLCNSSCVFYEDNSCHDIKCRAKEVWKQIR